MKTISCLRRFSSPLVGIIACLSSLSACWASQVASVDAPGEMMESTEAVDIAASLSLIRRSVLELHAKEGRAFRDAHRKSHGCVRADFEVLPPKMESLAVGIFKTPAKYPAWIRFSNGSGSSADDRKGDGRGMAIKVMGIGGAKLLEDEADAETQDFLMINHPVFFVRNATQYVGFQEAISKGSIRSLLWFLTPDRFGSAWQPLHELRIANAIRGKKVSNPLETRYFSMTASKWGGGAMKFSALPEGELSSYFHGPESANQLGENLVAHLKTKSARFSFAVQPRTRNAEEMPIEDPTVEWSEKDAPFYAVARINIPVQTPVTGEACDVMSFTPWHSIAEHRPLGSISRARKAVYEEVSKLRHSLNGEVREEPKK